MSDEVHIAGVVVRVLPECRTRASALIAQFDGTEIRVTDGRGKLVVVIEAASAREVLERLDAMQRIEGVLSASLVYQHAESAQSMNEEVLDEDVAS